jgi:hypothetical protein
LVVDHELQSTLRCSIDNISDRGARLRVSDPCILPRDFWLIAVTAGRAYEARVVWRNGPRVGLSLGDPICLSDPTGQLDRRLHTFWMAVR